MADEIWSSEPLMLVAILAAGASRRLGQPKQLVHLDGESLLRRQCRVAIDAQIGPVTVILGCQTNECAKSIADLPISTYVNFGWEEGLASSIRQAVQAAEFMDAGGLLIVHADQYRLTVNDLRLLHSVWAESPTSACVATYGDDFGPPVIFPSQHFKVLLQLRGDVGGRRVLAALRLSEVIHVPLPNAIHDLDTPLQLLAITGEG
jgi:molybdenum cofactor cytidylyltransferase